MQLLLEQIKKITVGALNVWEENGAFCFAKCTQKQVDAWYKIKQILGERAEATTGIRLDFHTNSSYFAFTTQNMVSYEIYIDGVFKYAYKEEEFNENLRKQIELDGEEHRITLYLPNHNEGARLESVEIDDGAIIEQHEFDHKILFVGDSITQGWDSTWESLSYAHQVSRFYNAESVIQGIGGAMYHMTTFDEEISFEPDIVIVAYGTNDWKYYETLGELKEHCCKFLDQLIERYGDKKIFAISPIWRADNGEVANMGSFESCVACIKDEIIHHGLILIDGDILMPQLSDFYSDGFLHPNTEGFGIYAINLIAQLQRYL